MNDSQPSSTSTFTEAPQDLIVVAMSGGVDSSVTAALLKEAGHDVVGISMRLYNIDDPEKARGCCSPDDLFDARTVCGKLGIPYYVSNDQKIFRERVIDHFVSEYLRGRTPNPCVLCNDHLKFDVLLSKAEALGAKSLATGHYARIDQTPEGRYRLLRGVDQGKDQSYFLFGLRRELLSKIIFPIGEMTKAETRALAKHYGLPTADKPESQEICFVTGTSYADLVEELAGKEALRPGRFIHQNGEDLGGHTGIHRFTIGQRKGLGISYNEPLFVKEIRPETGTVILGPRESIISLGASVSRANWLRWENPPETFEADLVVRYRARPIRANIRVINDGAGFEAEFLSAGGAVTPGQAAVLYDGDEVIGGGWIERALS